MTRFWLVRHGPTHAKGMVGWTDLPADLSDVAQLARLRAFLPEQAPVVSSDLSRAICTADQLPLGQRLAHEPALREMHFGSWELRRYDELERDPQHAAQIRAFWETPGQIRAPGGEGWDDLCSRVTDALERLAGTAPDVVVVCHFGPILAALQRAAQMTTQAALGHRIENLSVTCLDWGPQSQARLINHLP